MGATPADVASVHRTHAHLMTNWNLAGDALHQRIVLVQMLIDFCHTDSVQPTQVYLLKRRLFVHCTPMGDEHQGWYATQRNASVAQALHFMSGGTLGHNDGVGFDLHQVLYHNQRMVDRGDELLRLFQLTQLPQPVWHILTDVDDTIFAHPDWASIAGCDRSWDAHVPYPGIIPLYRRFYTHVPAMCRYSTVLSATPSIWKGRRMRDQRIHQVLNQSNIGFGFLHGFDTILPYFTSNRHARCGHEKFRKFVQYIGLFPEHRVIFIGDEGQGDVIAGRLMRTHYPDKCQVFIHRISVDAQTYTAQPNEHDAALHIHYFRDYAELAVLFQRELHLFTDADVEAVQREVHSLVGASSIASTQAYQRNHSLYTTTR